jgi:hypothetical protein
MTLQHRRWYLIGAGLAQAGSTFFISAFHGSAFEEGNLLTQERNMFPLTVSTSCLCRRTDNGHLVHEVEGSDEPRSDNGERFRNYGRIALYMGPEGEPMRDIPIVSYRWEDSSPDTTSNLEPEALRKSRAIVVTAEGELHLPHDGSSQLWIAFTDSGEQYVPCEEVRSPLVTRWENADGTITIRID